VFVVVAVTFVGDPLVLKQAVKQQYARRGSLALIG
jgi:hypothetical protein